MIATDRALQCRARRFLSGARELSKRFAPKIISLEYDSVVPGLWRLVLTVKSGPDAGRSCAVDRDVVVVGKMSDCDLVLTDSTVSRRHLRIARQGEDKWLVADLGSTNGTFVGGARVHEAEVAAGSVIR